ncbi:uncharacterized protein LOC143680653 isoform X7 [Tamandua tetradactyla]|uniref:uncharacterized protein LOC143680653 isoform X7 n=1 Tax=Tamandua tetradactyla TaxID=48850 RepID=UPI00405428B8
MKCGLLWHLLDSFVPKGDEKIPRCRLWRRFKGVRHPGCNANTWKSLENKDLEFTFRENKGLDGSTHSYLKGIWMDTLHLRLKTLK